VPLALIIHGITLYRLRNIRDLVFSSTYND
jgi:hypothetical protein